MRSRREQLEDEFMAGRLEGQTKKPLHVWCICVRWSYDVPTPDPKCRECHGVGTVERETGSNR